MKKINKNKVASVSGGMDWPFDKCTMQTEEEYRREMALKCKEKPFNTEKEFNKEIKINQNDDNDWNEAIGQSKPKSRIL